MNCAFTEVRLLPVHLGSVVGNDITWVLMIEAVLFDFGGVILTRTPNRKDLESPQD